MLVTRCTQCVFSSVEMLQEHRSQKVTTRRPLRVCELQSGPLLCVIGGLDASCDECEQQLVMSPPPIRSERATLIASRREGRNPERATPAPHAPTAPVAPAPEERSKPRYADANALNDTTPRPPRADRKAEGLAKLAAMREMTSVKSGRGGATRK